MSTLHAIGCAGIKCTQHSPSPRSLTISVQCSATIEWVGALLCYGYGSLVCGDLFLFNVSSNIHAASRHYHNLYVTCSSAVATALDANHLIRCEKLIQISFVPKRQTRRNEYSMRVKASRCRDFIDFQFNIA